MTLAEQVIFYALYNKIMKSISNKINEMFHYEFPAFLFLESLVLSVSSNTSTAYSYAPLLVL